MKKKIVLSVVASLIFAFVYLAEAQQAKKIPRIGFVVSTGSAVSPSPLLNWFQQGLRDLGYIEGKNILIEKRYAEGRLDRVPALADELIQSRVDIIVATNNVAIRAAKKATNTIPIVMVSSVDPIAAGYVESLAHPGGNVTGLVSLSRELSAKRMELLREVLPKVSRVAILWDANGPGAIAAFKEYEEAARNFKLHLQSLKVRGEKATRVYKPNILGEPGAS